MANHRFKEKSPSIPLDIAEELEALEHGRSGPRKPSRPPKPPTHAQLIDEFIDAAWMNDLDLIETCAKSHPWLVDKGNPHLLGALHRACGACCFDAARLLVEKYGADVNAYGPDGLNAMHQAMGARDMKIARMLIENGASVNAADRSDDPFVGVGEGATPLHYAIDDRNDKMVAFLLEKGADPTIRNGKGLDAIAYAFECAAKRAKSAAVYTGIAALMEKKREQLPKKPGKS